MTTTQRATSPAAGIQRGALIAFWLAFFAISLNLVMVVPLLPELASALDRPVGSLGVIVSAFALPYALLAPVLGPASERLGRRAMLLAGIGAFVAGQVLSALAPDLLPLLVARGLVGIGAAAFTPAAYAYVGDHTPPERRAATISAILTSAAFGSIVGLPLGGFAMAAAGWRGAFWLLAGLGVLNLLVLALVLQRDRPERVTRRYLTDLADVLRAAGTPVTLAITILWAAGYNGTLAYSGALLAERYTLPTEQVATWLGGLGIAGLLGNRLGAWLGPRLGDRRSLMIAIGGLLLAALLLPVTTVTPAVTVATAGLLPMSVQFGWPALLSIVSDLAPRSRATALALNNSAYYLGGVVGPPLVGLVIGHFGLSALGSVGVIVTSLALLLAGRRLAHPSSPVQ